MQHPNSIGSGSSTGILTHSTAADQGLVRLPQLCPHLQCHIVGEQQALLVSEFFNTLLHGRLICDLAPLLDGLHSLEEIAAALAGNHAVADVHAAIASLSAKGYIVSADHGMNRPLSAYWASLGASPRWAERQLADGSVKVEGDDGRLTRHLKAAGARVGSGDPKVTVVVCDDYLDACLAERNRRQLGDRAPWTLVRPRGIEVLFGPVFGRDEDGPCWECLACRMRGHQEVHGFLRNVAGEEAAFKPFATQPAAAEGVHGLIAAELAKWIVLQEAAPVHTQAIAMNVGTFTSSKHAVVRRPQCLACGSESLHRPDRPPVPLRLKDSPKADGSGSRTVAPEVTLARYRHLVGPVSGVVTWLSRTTDETDTWLHVNWAGSNMGMRSRTLSSLRRSLRSKSAGKGSTREQSEVSALCEAVERHSGVRCGDEIRIRRRFMEFDDGDEAIHPNDVQLFSAEQLDNAQCINAKGHPYNVVPNRFDPEAEVDWTPVWSFTRRRHRHLPTSMLYSMPAELRGPTDLIADSNGCAAGNTLEEAILQGFFELVERDAFAIWWYNRLRVPSVDLSSFNDEYLSGAPDYYARCDRELWVLDITSDFGIPVFVALSRRLNGQTEDIIYGAGAHADPRTAALRAICELNQCLTWLPRPGSGDGRPRIDDPLALWWWRTARLADCTWLAPAADAPPSGASSYPVVESRDIRDDVERCRALVESKSMEFLVLDQTRPDIGMPVVRVIVPGMRHFWARFAPGRLYDVPVRMGHRRKPLVEAELNPAPVVA